MLYIQDSHVIKYKGQREFDIPELENFLEITSRKLRRHLISRRMPEKQWDLEHMLRLIHSDNTLS